MWPLFVSETGRLSEGEMETQICNHCKEEKVIKAFNWRRKDLGIRQRTCRACQRQQQRNWYKKNKEIHISNMVEQRLQKLSAGHEFVWQYLSTHSCVECKEGDPIVLEFDHVKGRKRAIISRLVRNGHSIEVIQKEIEKCEVVCANCHRRRTYKNSWRDRQKDE